MISPEQLEDVGLTRKGAWMLTRTMASHANNKITDVFLYAFRISWLLSIVFSA